MDNFLTRKPRDKEVSTAVRGGIERLHELHENSQKRLE